METYIMNIAPRSLYDIFAILGLIISCISALSFIKRNLYLIILDVERDIREVKCRINPYGIEQLFDMYGLDRRPYLDQKQKLLNKLEGSLSFIQKYKFRCGIKIWFFSVFLNRRIIEIAGYLYDGLAFRA
jgi:hypothetical protein